MIKNHRFNTALLPVLWLCTLIIMMRHGHGTCVGECCNVSRLCCNMSVQQQAYCRQAHRNPGPLTPGQTLFIIVELWVEWYDRTLLTVPPSDSLTFRHHNCVVGHSTQVSPKYVFKPCYHPLIDQNKMMNNLWTRNMSKVVNIKQDLHALNNSEKCKCIDLNSRLDMMNFGILELYKARVQATPHSS